MIPADFRRFQIVRTTDGHVAVVANGVQFPENPDGRRMCVVDRTAEWPGFWPGEDAIVCAYDNLDDLIAHVGKDATGIIWLDGAPDHTGSKPQIEHKNLPLVYILNHWRPGRRKERDDGTPWMWNDEYTHMIDVEPFVPLDELHKYQPILLGNDGYVIDGHHRICAAIHYSLPSLEVAVVK